MVSEDKGDCFECGYILSEADKERDRCPRCGRHYHDDLEDFDGSDEDE